MGHSSHNPHSYHSHHTNTKLYQIVIPTQFPYQMDNQQVQYQSKNYGDPPSTDSHWNIPLPPLRHFEVLVFVNPNRVYNHTSHHESYSHHGLVQSNRYYHSCNSRSVYPH